jgi:3-carboxymuconate cyclase
VFVYLIDDNAGQLAAEGLNVNSAGTFAPISNFVPPPSLGFVSDGGMVVVSKKYLYLPLSNASVGSIYGYSIDGTTGALSLLSNAPYPVTGLQGTGSSFSIAADPAGKFIFVGDAAGISVYAINSNDGSLSLLNVTPVSTGIGAPIQMATDGLGKYLYLVDGTAIAEFSYNSAGLLSSLGTITSSISDLAMMSGEPSGKWMLGVRDQVGASGGVIDKNVYIFSINSTGTLVGTTPVSTPFAPVSLVVSPNDKFVYTFNEDDTSTSGTFLQPTVGFTFDSATGFLQNAVPFTDVLTNIGRIDQSGQTIVVIGQSSATAAAGTIPITILSDGTLSASSQHAGGAFADFVITDAP